MFSPSCGLINRGSTMLPADSSTVPGEIDPCCTDQRKNRESPLHGFHKKRTGNFTDCELPENRRKEERGDGHAYNLPQYPHGGSGSGSLSVL